MTLTIQATTRAILYQAPKTGWAVVSLLPESPLPPPLGNGHTPQPVTATGTWPGVRTGLTYSLTGKAVRNDTYGHQIELSKDSPPALLLLRA